MKKLLIMTMAMATLIAFSNIGTAATKVTATKLKSISDTVERSAMKQVASQSGNAAKTNMEKMAKKANIKIDKDTVVSMSVGNTSVTMIPIIQPVDNSDSTAQNNGDNGDKKGIVSSALIHFSGIPTLPDGFYTTMSSPDDQSKTRLQNVASKFSKDIDVDSNSFDINKPQTKMYSQIRMHQMNCKKFIDSVTAEVTK